MAVCLQTADHRLDSGPSPGLLLDGAEDAAVLAGDVDAERFGYLVAAVALIGIDALDL